MHMEPQRQLVCFQDLQSVTTANQRSQGIVSQPAYSLEMTSAPVPEAAA